jgi:hypothetical protein
MNNKTSRKKGAATATTFPIEIDPNGYAGHYYTDYGVERTGAATVDLAAGKRFVCPYGWGKEFEVYFTVLPNGRIDPTSIAPKGAATANGAKLTFATVEVEIDPGQFRGIYQVGGFTATKGISTVRLLVNTWNIFEIYSTGSGSFVQIEVAANGNIFTRGFSGATTCKQRSAKMPARVIINTRKAVFSGAPGVSGEVFFGSSKSLVVTVGDRTDVVINYPVSVINKSLKWPEPDMIVGTSPGREPLAPVPLFSFV